MERGAGAEDTVYAHSGEFQAGGCGEGELGGGAGMGCEEPMAVRIAQKIFKGGVGVAGETRDGGRGKAAGAEERGDAWRPGGEFGEKGCGCGAGGDTGGEQLDAGVYGVAEGARVEGSLGTGELSGIEFGGVGGVAVGKGVGAGFGEACGGIEVEWQALVRVG